VSQQGRHAPASVVMDGEAMGRAWKRVAHEIVERNRVHEPLLLAGVPTRGVPLAHRLAALLRSLGAAAEVTTLPVDGHRDDRDAPSPAAARPEVPVRDRVVIVVDDVIFHGRTARAALDALTELGRPRAVQLAALVDRGHRELPIKADYVGKNIPTAMQDRVQVHLAEVDGVDAVVVFENGMERGPARPAPNTAGRG
jgi:pyrimidine operon attenuation protein/uracil phosphoribosyltransferase